MPATAAHYVTFLAKYVPPSPHHATAVFLGMNGKDTHYLSVIYGYTPSQPKNLLLSPKTKNRTPDSRHRTPEIPNPRFSAEICKLRSEETLNGIFTLMTVSCMSR